MKSLEQISKCMKDLGNMHPSYKGFARYAVDSTEIQKSLLYEFLKEHGKICLIVINVPKYVVYNEYLLKETGRAIIYINSRHFISVRRDHNGNFAVLDTSRLEDSYMESRSDNVIMFMKQHLILCKDVEDVYFDINTPQQEMLKGGCSVMSLCNHLLPDAQYASKDDGECLREKYANIIYNILVSGKTPEDIANDFDKYLTEKTEWIQHNGNNVKEIL